MSREYDTVVTHREVSDALVALICKVHSDKIKRTHRTVAQAKWDAYLKANERKTYWELNVEIDAAVGGAQSITNVVGRMPIAGGIFLSAKKPIIDAAYAFDSEKWARKAADRVRRAFGSKVTITVSEEIEE